MPILITHSELETKKTRRISAGLHNVFFILSMNLSIYVMLYRINNWRYEDANVNRTTWSSMQEPNRHRHGISISQHVSCLSVISEIETLSILIAQFAYLPKRLATHYLVWRRLWKWNEL